MSNIKMSPEEKANLAEFLQTYEPLRLNEILQEFSEDSNEKYSPVTNKYLEKSENSEKGESVLSPILEENKLSVPREPHTSISDDQTETNILNKSILEDSENSVQNFSDSTQDSSENVKSVQKSSKIFQKSVTTCQSITSCQIVTKSSQSDFKSCQSVVKSCQTLVKSVATPKNPHNFHEKENESPFENPFFVSKRFSYVPNSSKYDFTPVRKTVLSELDQNDTLNTPQFPFKTQKVKDSPETFESKIFETKKPKPKIFDDDENFNQKREDFDSKRDYLNSKQDSLSQFQSLPQEDDTPFENPFAAPKRLSFSNHTYSGKKNPFMFEKFDFKTPIRIKYDPPKNSTPLIKFDLKNAANFDSKNLNHSATFPEISKVEIGNYTNQKEKTPKVDKLKNFERVSERKNYEPKNDPISENLDENVSESDCGNLSQSHLKDDACKRNKLLSPIIEDRNEKSLKKGSKGCPKIVKVLEFDSHNDSHSVTFPEGPKMNYDSFEGIFKTPQIGLQKIAERERYKCGLNGFESIQESEKGQNERSIGSGKSQQEFESIQGSQVSRDEFKSNLKEFKNGSRGNGGEIRLQNDGKDFQNNNSGQNVLDKSFEELKNDQEDPYDKNLVRNDENERKNFQSGNFGSGDHRIPETHLKRDFDDCEYDQRYSQNGNLNSENHPILNTHCNAENSDYKDLNRQRSGFNRNFPNSNESYYQNSYRSNFQNSRPSINNNGSRNPSRIENFEFQEPQYKNQEQISENESSKISRKSKKFVKSLDFEQENYPESQILYSVQNHNKNRVDSPEWEPNPREEENFDHKNNQRIFEREKHENSKQSYQESQKRYSVQNRNQNHIVSPEWEPNPREQNHNIEHNYREKNYDESAKGLKRYSVPNSNDNKIISPEWETNSRKEQISQRNVQKLFENQNNSNQVGDEVHNQNQKHFRDQNQNQNYHEKLANERPSQRDQNYREQDQNQHFEPQVSANRHSAADSRLNAIVQDRKNSNENLPPKTNQKPTSDNFVKPTEVPRIEPIGKSAKDFKTLTIKRKPYIIISKLGEGGTCQVFDCLDRDTLQHRAVKIVNLAVDAVTASGCVNEVKMLKALQGSDYVIKIFDYEITNNTLFVVMEKGGIDLSVFLRNIANKSSFLPNHVINYYWMEMLTCVKEIHDAGIIHSDLKPSNFLIVDGRLKLIDFGIASRLSSDMTSIIKNVQVGTFNYISPEALLDSRGGNNSPVQDSKPRIKISYKSDVWSLGCILYQLVYRKTPFHSIGNTYAKICIIVDPNHKIEYPNLGHVPLRMIETIQKCLQYDMKLRPTVNELISINNEI